MKKPDETTTLEGVGSTGGLGASWCVCEPTECKGVGKCRWQAMGYRPGEVLLLRADAERYRWLRDNEELVNVQISRICGSGSPKEMDAAIDAAMKASNKT